MRHLIRPALAASLLPLVFACSAAPAGSGPTSPSEGADAGDECATLEAETSGEATLEPGSMTAFTSEAALSAYLADIEAKQKALSEKVKRCTKPSPGMYADAGAAAAPPAPEAKPSNEGITNNQEAAADEGGIVKNIGSHLVVLRKGRLFAVDVSAGPRLSDSLRVAPTTALNSSVWYDEMLVKGDLVYVVGYRYRLPGGGAHGATEIDTFRLADGKLTRLRSMFLESSDYFSGSNYASRMVDGKLVFYMPHRVGRQGEALSYPRVLELGPDGAVRPVGPMFGALDVTRSRERSTYPTFHTMVQCALPDTGGLDCRAKSVIGSASRQHYVSAGAAYLWSSRQVYRFDLATLDVTAHAADDGVPINQLAFKETPAALLVATLGRTGPSLVKLPLAAFDKMGAQAVTRVSLGLDSLRANRFVGARLIASGTRGGNNKLVAVDPDTGTTTQILSPAAISLEPLGTESALVVAQRPAGGTLLQAYSTVDLSGPPGELELPDLRPGESRTHAFFFKPSAAGGGTLGYAMVNESGRSGGFFGSGVSNVAFFSTTASRAIAKIGVVSSGNVSSPCETSCVDWYGNTRPIFLGDRVFALMGSELAEVSLAAGAARVGSAAELHGDPTDSSSP